MINIVVPMAGNGVRFVKEGYLLPKPLIDVRGKSMIEIVVKNITPSYEHRMIFVCLKEHDEKYHLTPKLKKLCPNCIVLLAEGTTAGPACTVLLARELIDNDVPLMVANCDQWVDIKIDDYLEHMSSSSIDGLIMTMRAVDPKWSFVALDTLGRVSHVAEKQPISSEATVGIYNFRYGKDFVKYADRMIAEGRSVNGEYYVAPVYNLIVQDGKVVGVYNVGALDQGMFGLGTPEDFERFIANPASGRAVGQSGE